MLNCAIPGNSSRSILFVNLFFLLGGGETSQLAGLSTTHPAKAKKLMGGKEREIERER